MIDPERFGVTFSLKQCRNFGLDPKETLRWLIDEAGFRRFRLMSYWNEHEKQPGQLDFQVLDWQIKMISEAGGVVTLCLGARQPRWPENHWPNWAWELPKDERTAALLRYNEAVVERYKDEACIVSYQLENEALLKRWGDRPEVDRRRLRQEFDEIKRLDSSRPVVMTTSTSWGIPLRRPKADIVGFSYYRTIYRDGAYHQSLFYPWVHRMRKRLINIFLRQPVFIHELQCEPWGPSAIWKMDNAEQGKSMSSDDIALNIDAAKRIKAYPVDLWGGEWWYWRLKQGDAGPWQAVRQALRATDH